MKIRGCFLTKNTVRNMSQLIMRRGRTSKSSASTGELRQYYGTYVCIRFQQCWEPTIIQRKITIYKTQQGSKFLKGGVDCATNVVALCARFVDMVSPVQIQVENGLSKIFDFWGQTVDVSDQYVLT